MRVDRKSRIPIPSNHGSLAAVIVSQLPARKKYLAKLVQTPLRPLNIIGPFLDNAVSVLQDIPMRFQPRVELDDTLGNLSVMTLLGGTWGIADSR